MTKISINDSQVSKLIELLRASGVPSEKEKPPFPWTRDLRELANAYFAIVAVCHQTSPIGERALQGYVGQDLQLKRGWDYLKEKFLLAALNETKWTSAEYWKELTPNELSALYQDETLGKKYGDETIGKTLNRVNERAYLINDLGRRLAKTKTKYIDEAFGQCGQTIEGETGFASFLEKFEAYRDPVRKKSLFFLAIAAKECKWVIKDNENLASPIDYHELRGHLRIGTLIINDKHLSFKIQRSLTLTEREDTELRRKAQEVNDQLGKATGLGSSIVHYLFWNVFRNCCPRESSRTHCADCGERCELPAQYKEMATYKHRCVFSAICYSANKSDKVIEPPYLGHFY